MSWTDIWSWAQDRLDDIERREGFNSLSSVGPDKPMGAFGFDTRPQAKTAARALDPGVRSVVKKVRGVGYWVYAWHPPALSALLISNRKHLPTRWLAASFRGANPDCLGFVNYCRGHKAKAGTPLFDLIADAYGDKTGPGRTDVMLGVPRQELLDAFRTVTGGQMEPTAIYFR